MSEIPEVIPFGDTFDGLYGLEIVEHSDGYVRGRVTVQNHHKQSFGLVHGGLYASMAESLTSLGTYFGVAEQGAIAMGQANSTSFLRPITEGHVHATCRARHRGRTTWLWDVDITDDQDRLCAVVRMTIAVRHPQERPAGA
jgi:1,4-dihydroxy-2-naphthoyl-CoA hydrolase